MYYFLDPTKDGEPTMYVMPVVVYGDAGMTIEPYIYYIFGNGQEEMPELEVTFDTTYPENDGVVKQYMFEFISGATATKLTLPDDVRYTSSAETILPNKRYQVSIINNIVSMVYTDI